MSRSSLGLRPAISALIVFVTGAWSTAYLDSDRAFATEPISASISGSWSGTWRSTRGPTGALSVAITQDGGSVRGTVQLSGSPRLSGGTFAGTISGTALVMNAEFGPVKVQFVGTISGQTGAGTYTSEELSDKGTWSVIFATRPPSMGEVLTNESVLAMVRAGLTDDVIVAKIRSTATNFDLTHDQLIRLKHQGVPDRVLEAMLSPGAPSSPATAHLPSTEARDVPHAGALLPLGVVEHVKADGVRVPLKRVFGKLEFTYGVFFTKTELVVPRRRAPYRVTERQPTFRIDLPDAEGLRLVRLRPGGKDDRNLKVKSSHMLDFKFTQTMGLEISEDDTIRLIVEPDGKATRMRPAEPLRSGEYGFLPTYGGTVGGFEISEFGVD